MDGFFKDFFIRIMQISSSDEECVEISSLPIVIGGACSISIITQHTNVIVSFSSNDNDRIIIEAPKDTPSDIVNVVSTIEQDTLCFSVVEHTQENINLIVHFIVSPALKNVHIISDSGDITLEHCKSPNVHIETISGDIIVLDHITPCNIKTVSVHGDVTRLTSCQRSSNNTCVCKTTNGDIVIR